MLSHVAAAALWQLRPSATPRIDVTVERSEILELFDHARSDLESMFLALCDAHGLPRPLVNHVVHDKEVDFLAATLGALVGDDQAAAISSAAR